MMRNEYNSDVVHTGTSPGEWGCIFGLKAGKMETAVKQKLQESYDENRLAELTKKAALQQELDGGNTISLKNEAATWNQSYLLRNKLMDVAPFVTEAVMKEAIENQSGLTDGMLLEVLDANPDLAKQPDFIDFVLGNRPNLPAWTEDMLLDNAEQISAPTNLPIPQLHYWVVC